MKILVSGFEPFGGDKLNSANEVIKLLPASICASDGANKIEIVTTLLPVELGASLEHLKSEVERHRPDAVLSIGQASGRVDINMEMIGINCCDFAIPDNSGNMPDGEPVLDGGADGIFTTLPNKRIVAALLDEGIPASLSYSAGTYVCNYLCYGLSHYLRENHPDVRSGFMHVPLIHEQVVDLCKNQKPCGKPSLALATLKCAVLRAIRTIFE